MTRTTGQRITLDKLERALRASANELIIDINIHQLDDEVTACKYVSRERNKCDGIMLVPGVWNVTGHQLLETITIVGKPVGLFLPRARTPGCWYRETSDGVTAKSVEIGFARYLLIATSGAGRITIRRTAQAC